MKKDFEIGTTKKCHTCKEDLLIKRADGSLYCQTCVFDSAFKKQSK